MLRQSIAPRFFDITFITSLSAEPRRSRAGATPNARRNLDENVPTLSYPTSITISPIVNVVVSINRRARSSRIRVRYAFGVRPNACRNVRNR